ncbi:transmembrane protein 130-like [Glandiceps talaboti]
MSRRLIRIFLPTLVLLNSTFSKTSTPSDTSKEKGILILRNDGPTIADAITTFYAALVDDDNNEDNSDNQYLYEWKDDVPWHEEISQVSNANTKFSVKYTKLEIGSDHVMEVKVFKYRNGKKRSNVIAKAETIFTITEFMNGELNAVQQNVTSSKKWTYATNATIEFTAGIYDPSHYFNASTMLFMWDFGNDMVQNTTKPSALASYPLAGRYNVSVKIKASVPLQPTVYIVKSGQFNQTLTLMDPVENVAMYGSNTVTVGHDSNYTMTCTGSMPVTMCWYLNLDGSCEVGINQTFTDVCQEVVLKKTCQLNLVHYFNSTGQMCLTVIAYNDISLDVASLDIKVNKPAPGPSPAVTASMTSLAALTAIGGILVAIFAVHQLLRARRMHRVEVADFDFIRSYKRKEKSQRPMFPVFSFQSKKTEKKPLMNEFGTSAPKHKYSSFQEIL